MLRRALERRGLRGARDGDRPRGGRGVLREPPDLLVLDIGLPDADGRDVCQALRAHGVDAPVLFLTARGALTDRLSGFHAGGDDYLTKPFALAELLVRVHALLRRSRAARVGRAPAPGLRLDPAAHGVRARRAHRGADADRVPPAGRARRRARRGACAGASWSRPRGRTARSCTTTRSTPTSGGCGASCASSGAARQIETARGVGYVAAVSLAPGASRWPRSRSLGVGLAIARRRAEPAARQPAERRRRRACCANRADAAARHARHHGRGCACATARGDAVLDEQAWVFDATRPRDRAPAADRDARRGRDDALARRRAREPARTSERVRAARRCRCSAAAATGVGTVVVGVSLAPYERHRAPRARSARCCSACSCSRAGALLARRAVGDGAAAGGRHDRAGRGLERARPRPALRPRRRRATS